MSTRLNKRPKSPQNPLNHPPRLVLASASPRRFELLHEAGYTAEVRVSPVREPQERPDYIPVDLWPMMLAFIKAHAVQKTLDDTDAIIIGADTIVVVDNQILGKPRDRRHARVMLEQLSGRKHEVITGLALLRGKEQRMTRAFSICQGRQVSTQWLEEYLDRGLWRGKAGAYGIQDHHDPFVTLISGEWSNVVGLPMELLAAEIKSFVRLQGASNPRARRGTAEPSPGRKKNP